MPFQYVRKIVNFQIKESTSSQFKVILNWLILAFLVFSLSQLTKTYLFSFALVKGQSMEPWLKAGDVVFLSKWDKNYPTGSIIALKNDAHGPILVKRLIASGPASLYLENGVVFIDHIPYLESATEPPEIDKDLYWCLFTAKIAIPEDSIFVLGDNRCKSSDSRFFGPVKRVQIYGKVKFRLMSVPKFVLTSVSQ